MAIWARYLAHLLAYDAHARTTHDKLTAQLDPFHHHITPCMPPYPPIGRPLLIEHVPIVPRKQYQAEAYNHIFRFLCGIHVCARPSSNLSGITWLELRGLYFLRGGTLCLHSTDAKNSHNKNYAASKERFEGTSRNRNCKLIRNWEVLL